MTTPKVGRLGTATDSKVIRRKGRASSAHVGASGGAAEPRATPALSLGGLENRVGYLLRCAQIQVFRDFIQTMAEFDIRPAQFSVLAVIRANPGLTQRAVGQTLDIEPARLVLVLDELERRGLTKREPAPNDRRSRLLSLTPAGEAQLHRLIALADEHEERVLSGISAKDREQLLKVLAQLCRVPCAASSDQDH